MTTPETITSRINAQADAKLESELAELVAKFNKDLSALCDISSVSIARAFIYVRDGNMITTVNGLPDHVRISVSSILNAIHEEAFAIAHEDNRKTAMDAFLTAVDEAVQASPELQEKIAEQKMVAKLSKS